MSSMSADGHLPPECLGFCGRQLLNITPAIWSPCAACEWGSRTMARNWCEPCRKFIAPYDWMYLGFMALFPFLLHVFFVRRSRKYCRSKRYEILEHLCCVLENLISCVIALMAFPPRFSFSLYGCEKSTWREWYPTYYNPIIDYTKSMRCTYEVVFPLYSLPLFHELLLVAAILVFRTALYCTIMYKTYNGKPFYYAMLSLPIIAGLHALMAGFIYYVFPYCLLLGSVGANVVHLALEGKKTIKEIIVHVFTSPLQIVFLSVNMLLFAFSLVALLSPTGVTNGLFWLLLVPVPLIFYLFTIPFSHPNSISEAE